MAESSGGTEAGKQVPFNFKVTGTAFDLDGPNPIPPIDPNHAASEKWIVRDTFGGIPSPNEQIGEKQSPAPPAPKMPVQHGNDSLAGDEVIYS